MAGVAAGNPGRVCTQPAHTEPSGPLCCPHTEGPRSKRSRVMGTGVSGTKDLISESPSRSLQDNSATFGWGWLWEAEAGGFRVGAQPGQLKILCQKSKTGQGWSSVRKLWVPSLVLPPTPIKGKPTSQPARGVGRYGSEAGPAGAPAFQPHSRQSPANPRLCCGGRSDQCRARVTPRRHLPPARKPLSLLPSPGAVGVHSRFLKRKGENSPPKRSS